MEQFNHILAKHEKDGGMPLITHLRSVAILAEKIAIQIGLDPHVAYRGAILHDIGKVSPLFQQTLKNGYVRKPGFIFRHEIASLFFIHIIPKNERAAMIDMIAAHHKSIYNDIHQLGLLDLDQNSDSFEIHAKGFEDWCDDAIGILNYFGITTEETTTLNIARSSYEEAVSHCMTRRSGCSKWKGVLTGADYLASAMGDYTPTLSPNRLFIKPDLSFYKRENQLYPLSLIAAQSFKRHTLVTAPTGAGKTDFLLRRCNGRVFYTLPFQASINAMFERIKEDLKDTDADVRFLHASSAIKIDGGKIEEKILQKHIGASVKVLTPHQISSLVFGTKGFEAMAVDLMNCDVILDEIHTYSGISQAIVLKIVEVLQDLNCRIHIGTATMPSALYNRLFELLKGDENVYEVKLKPQVLDSFNRHIVHKINDKEEINAIINEAINLNSKILIVCNQVKRAQNLYIQLQEQYPEIKAMLLHSRFKRAERNELENRLKNEFNNSKEVCIVVSTQVVEVSLDISFDLMITECAPLDSLIQRFGRINRKRNANTIGKYKHVYVLEPSSDIKDALPYDLEVLQRSFAILPDNQLLEERNLQSMLDATYPEIVFTNIDLNTVFKDNKWRIKELSHHPKSALLEILDIESAVCICEHDRDRYFLSNYSDQSKMEIPVSYRSIAHNHLDQLKEGNRPFVVPDKAYNKEIGLDTALSKPSSYDLQNQFL
ncbi:MAG: CRISPR-associated helicase Cas3' [Bacteroidetes bacterium]|nr:CRISPR-associated helicase Cas3' [Bacteroidota bacterium]